MTNKTEVLTKAEASVAAVDSLLTNLSTLTNDAQTLSSSIAALQNDEADLLKSDAKNEESKIRDLLKLRATIDVKAANLARVRNEISALQAELRIVGDKAQLWLGALIDALIVARRNRVTEQLKAIFIDRAQLELKSFLPYSVAVHEVEVGIGRLQFYPVSQPERNIDTALKVRPVFTQLAALVEAEAEIDLIVGESW